MAANAPAAKRKTVKLTDDGPRVWTFEGVNLPDGSPQEFIQDRMSFFEKNEFMGLAASVVDDAIRNGLDVARLVTTFLDQQGNLQEAMGDLQKGIVRVEALPAMGQMMMMLLQLLSTSSTKLEDAYMVALSIDPAGRPWFRGVLRAEQDDEKMFAIWQTFVDQNAEHLAAFLPRFVAQLRATSAAIQTASALQRDSSPPSSD